MKKYLLFLLFFFGVFTSHSQQWKTVGLHDTTYFRGGVFNYDSFRLHVIWIDSARQIGSDSLFTFYKTVRDTTNGNGYCLDTAAASWLGPAMLRKSNGDEYYFNLFKDTILIKTTATYGAIWLMAKDTGNVTIQATITAVGLTVVDGVTDSFKTISLQAYSNGLPVASGYNLMKLQLSKDHGWLQALDFFAFPERNYYAPSNNSIGIKAESAPLYRLPAAFGQTDINAVDLAWKYAPGNEFIYSQEERLFNNPYRLLIQHDSIIAMQTINSSSISFTAKRDEYRDDYSSPSQSTSSNQTYYHTDTVIRPAFTKIISQYCKPEAKNYPMDSALPRLNTTYFLDSFCGRYIIKSRYSYFDDLGKSTGCWAVIRGFEKYIAKDYDTLSGFGQTYYHMEIWSGNPYPEFYYNNIYTYFKIGNCTMGTKINVSALGVSTLAATSSFRLYPNPATDRLYLSSSVSQPQGATITLTDVTGRTCLSKAWTGAHEISIPVDDLPRGVYFIMIRSATKTEAMKVLLR